MGEVTFQGGMDAIADGTMVGTPDLRIRLVMTGFSGEAEPEAQTLADFATLDEFDGLGYVALDCANVAFAYDATDHRYYLTFDSGAGGEFGDPVAPGSDVIKGMLLTLYVDGTLNDIAYGFTDVGGFGVNANNGPLNLTLDPDGLHFMAEA